MGSSTSTVQRQCDENKIVAAIDFGTTYSGYAYCFSNDQSTIITAKHGYGLSDDRVPTVLLLNPDDTFNSFGLDAEDTYARLAFDKKHRMYRLFEKFKMSLYSKERFESTLTIVDQEGRQMKAMKLFAIVINHLKQVIIKSMKGGKIGDIDSIEDSIFWILTIPAIWSDSARQFMRLAAVEGGIPDQRLRLVLEPEAAAVLCKDELLRLVPGAGLTALPKGTKYILADLGGGTADICVHEVLDRRKVRELYRSTGGAFGGASVNEKYVEFLQYIFGNDIWRKFKDTESFDYNRLMRDFEDNKKKFDYDQTEKVIIDIPQSIIKLFHGNLQDAVNMSSYSAFIEVRENKLVCMRELIESFFKPSITDGILPKLDEIMKACSNDAITALIVVGGYAESKYLRESITKTVENIKVVLSKQPRLAVLLGAVKIGFEPGDIIERRSRFTYGFSVAVPFNEKIHPEFLKFKREGKFYCNHIFGKLFEKNSILKFGQEFKVTTADTFQQIESKNIALSVSLHRSTEENPRYCLESWNCIEAGKIIVKPPQGGWPVDIRIDNILVVGETEFKVKAIDRVTDRHYETSVDFL